MNRRRLFLFVLGQTVVMAAAVLLPRICAPIYGAHSTNDSPWLVMTLVSGGLLLLDSIWVGILLRWQKQAKWKWLAVCGVCMVVTVWLTLWLGGGSDIPSTVDALTNPSMWAVCLSASVCLFLPCALIAAIDPSWWYERRRTNSPE